MPVDRTPAGVRIRVGVGALLRASALVVHVGTDVGTEDVRISEPVDTFGGASGEQKARAFDVYGYAFLARKPEGVSAADDRLGP
jgi:hypothetical protein